jgi:hypothetical protein
MFINIRDKFCKELERVSINLEKSCWDFYTNSTAENLKRYEEAQDEYSKVFQNRDWYNKFLAINKDELSKHEQKQLKELLKEFDEELNTGEELKALRKKENEIAQKYNSYIPKIDGKEVSKPEIFKIMQTETNPDLRKKAYDAKIKGADLIAEDMIEFVKNLFCTLNCSSQWFYSKRSYCYRSEQTCFNSFFSKFINSGSCRTCNYTVSNNKNFSIFCFVFFPFLNFF